MKFAVTDFALESMREHIDKKAKQHAKFDKDSDFSPDTIRVFSMEQMKLKMEEMVLRDDYIGYTEKSLDDAKDLVHYALFVLESYLAEE